MKLNKIIIKKNILLITMILTSYGLNANAKGISLWSEVRFLDGAASDEQKNCIRGLVKGSIQDSVQENDWIEVGPISVRNRTFEEAVNPGYIHIDVKNDASSAVIKSYLLKLETRIDNLIGFIKSTSGTDNVASGKNMYSMARLWELGEYQGIRADKYISTIDLSPCKKHFMLKP